MDYAIYQLACLFARQVSERYAPLAVYLYGSQANGTATERSDIDIAVIMPPMAAQERMKLLAELISMAAKIDGSIEPYVVIDSGEFDKFSFYAEVVETGIKLL